MNTPATKIPVPPQPPHPKPLLVFTAEAGDRLERKFQQGFEVHLEAVNKGNESWAKNAEPPRGSLHLSITNHEAFGFGAPGEDYVVHVYKAGTEPKL